MRQIRPARSIFIPPIIFFSLISFVVSFGDGIMSYITPVAIENHLNDTALVGLVLSISSIFGMFLDMVIAQKFALRDYKFFLTRTLVFAVMFPLTFLLFPAKFVYFALAMIVWSLYYEFLGYSRYNFIYKFTPTDEHTKSWSILSTFDSVAYMIGPGAAIFLLEKHSQLPFYVVIALVFLATILFVLFSKSTKKNVQSRALTPQLKKNIIKELGIMHILMNKLWILIIFCFVITLIDVSMWTIGILYAEKLRKTYELGGWFMVVYGIPALFTGIITSKIYQDLGKKRTAYVAGAVAGLSILFMGLSSNIYSILIFVFLMSTFYGIASILLNATFQDYVTRINKAGNDIISLLQFSANLAYSVGPIILGLTAKYLGFGKTFAALGGLIITTALVSILLTPAKIKMPQKEIAAELKC